MSSSSSIPSNNPKENMADYFTKFSFALTLPDKAAQEYALGLAQAASHAVQGDELPASFPKALAEVKE